MRFGALCLQGALCEIQARVYFQIDVFSRDALIGQPLGRVVDRYLQGLDIFGMISAAGACFGESGREKKGDALVGQARRRGAFEGVGHVFGFVAGLFEQFAMGGALEGFVFLAGDVTGEAGGSFDDGVVERRAVLLDEDDAVVVCDGNDTDDA